MSHARNRAARRGRQAAKTTRQQSRAGTGARDRIRARDRTPARDRAGAGRPPGRTAYRRALRREAPVVVGLLLDDHDFTAMARYPSFPFDDYRRYLHHVDELLRRLHAQGTHVAVTLFDPAAYTDYCQGTRQPPDAPDTRTRYVAEASTTGPSVRYARQPLAALRGDLAREADRRATWERATDFLVDAGPCPDCGQNLAHCAFDRASHTLLRLIEAVGPGAHHVVCSLPLDDDGPPLLASATVTAPPPRPAPDAGAASAPPGPPPSASGTGHDADPQADADPGPSRDPHQDRDPTSAQELHVTEADALVLCTVMAAGAVTARPGGLVIRTTAGEGADRTETVRGWSLRGGEPLPLTEAEVFNAYCTDPATGEPVPPEHGVRYRAGLPLPPPLPGDTR